MHVWTQRSGVGRERILRGKLAQRSDLSISESARLSARISAVLFRGWKKSPSRHSSSFTLSGCARATSLAVGQETRSYQSPQLGSVRSSRRIQQLV
ncbi:hypothetical protein QQF64_001818 [Cirrhinus molitorella]|uniref:Uncharacterized protein n=1 Tax=Cirrhinus molitorella TaxID=172907 RepID=A0ABR3MNC4_9TELE